MAVIKNVTRKTEITKELIFPLDVIADELKKKYRMNSDATSVEWVENFTSEDGEDLGTCLVLKGTSVPRKKAAPVEAEAAE